MSIIPIMMHTSVLGIKHHKLPASVADFGATVFKSSAQLQNVLDHVVRDPVVMYHYGGGDGSAHTYHIWHMAHDKNWAFGMSDRFVEVCANYSRSCQTNLQVPSALYFEIGANIGIATVHAAKMFPTLRTISVEASPINALLHKMNLAENGLSDANHTTIYAAMQPSSNDMPLSFLDCGAVMARESKVVSRGSSELSERHANCTRTSVPTITLSAVLVAYGLKRIHLMRQDCEGCEMSTLPAWRSSKLLMQIDYYTGEFHPALSGSEAEVRAARNVLCSGNSHTRFMGFGAMCAQNPPPPLPPSPPPPSPPPWWWLG